MKKKESKFGKGFIYNLFLFAKHYERLNGYLDCYRKIRERKDIGKDLSFFSDDRAVSIWFNEAGDHFFEFEIPTSIKKTVMGKKFISLQKKALEFRCGDVSKKDFDAFFEDLEKLTIIIDKEIFNINCTKATWN
jgi:hypothetical protein